MAKHDFILQGLMARTHTSALERVLKLPDLDYVLVSVAYLNEGGVLLVQKALKAVAKRTTAFVGIRNDATSLQGLRQLLDIGVDLYAVDTGSARLIFHPKLYLTMSKTHARLIIGSANLTAGGLNNNIEAGIASDLDRTNKDDEALLKQITDEFAALPKSHPDHVIRITKAKQLDALVKEERLLDETQVEPPKPYTASPKGSGDRLPKIKLLVKPVRRPVAKKSAAAAAAATASSAAAAAAKAAGVATPPVASAWEHVWDSTPLTERDLNVPSGANTNVTGSINLDKGLLTPKVDHRHYFRDQVFDSLAWTPGSRPTVEEADAEFQLVIKGVDYGTFDLRVAHTTSTTTASYLQHNAMTRLRWGPMKQYVADPKFVGRTMSLYRDTVDPKRFLVELD